MSVSRKVIAEVCEVPEEYVSCKTCICRKDGTTWCRAWKDNIKLDAFCSFWADEKEEES